MKRALCLCVLLPALLLSGGCGGKLLFRDLREIDQLVAVETLGVDRSGKLYLASVSAGEEGEVLLKSPAVTISRALEEIQEYTEKKYVFYGHTRHLLLGETAARSSLLPCLSYVERDGELRLDTSLYIVKDGTAEDLISRAGGERCSVGELLDSLEKDMELLGVCHVCTCGEVAEALAERGSALTAAVMLSPSERDLSGEQDTSLLTWGYAVLLPSGLCRFLDGNLSRGVGLLTGETGGDIVEAPDGEGGWFAARLTGSRASFVPRYEAGELREVLIRVEVFCTLDEVHSALTLTDAETIRTMEEGIAGLEQGRVEEVLRISRELGADFCDLGGQIRRAAPWRFDRMERSWAEQFPELPLRLEVTARLQRSYEGSVSPEKDSGGRGD